MKYSEVKEKDGILYYDIYTEENLPELRKVEEYYNAKDNPETGDFDELFVRVYHNILDNSIRDTFKGTEFERTELLSIQNEWDDIYIKGACKEEGPEKELYKKALKLAGDTIIDFYKEYLKNEGRTEDCVEW